MKRIVHITTVHSVSDTRIFFKECISLVKSGYHVKLIVKSDNSYRKDGVEVIGIKIPQNRFMRFVVGSIRALSASIRAKGDIYHFHDPELIFVGLLLKCLGNKVIYDVHEDVSKQILSKYWIPMKLRKMVAYLYKKVENFAAKWLDYIIVITPTIRDAFLNRGYKCIDVNNYSLLSEFNLQKNTNKENQVCYIGGITEIRGVRQMIAAVEQTNVRLALGGIFSPPSLRDDCLILSGWKHVNELGFLDRVDVCRIMAESNVGLLLFHPVANHIEAQPNKLFEYMAAGIPVIASNFPLWHSIIVDNNCGLCVDPFDIKAISDAISYLIENPMIAQKMGNNGRKLVEERFNWGKEEKKLLRIYNEVMP